jgi:hypothetical protein
LVFSFRRVQKEWTTPNRELHASDGDPLLCARSLVRNMRVSLISRLTAILAFVSLSLQAKDQLKDFCRRWGHATAIVDRRMYIDGGYINYSPLNQNPGNFTSRF